MEQICVIVNSRLQIAEICHLILTFRNFADIRFDTSGDTSILMDWIHSVSRHLQTAYWNQLK
jgi:hypothetical protein